jgi:hypothetical protein
MIFYSIGFIVNAIQNRSEQEPDHQISALD